MKTFVDKNGKEHPVVTYANPKKPQLQVKKAIGSNPYAEKKQKDKNTIKID